MVPLLPIGLAALSFLLSGGVGKLERQFNGNDYDNPSLGEWAETAGMTGLGAFTGGAGEAGLIAKTGVGGLQGLSKLIEGNKALNGLGMAAKTALASPGVRMGMGASALMNNLPGYAIRALDTDPYNNPSAEETMGQIMGLAAPVGIGMAYGPASALANRAVGALGGLGTSFGGLGNLGGRLGTAMSTPYGQAAMATPPVPWTAAQTSGQTLRQILAGLPPRVPPVAP